jgi:hypothetical protein
VRRIYKVKGNGFKWGVDIGTAGGIMLFYRREWPIFDLEVVYLPKVRMIYVRVARVVKRKQVASCVAFDLAGGTRK